MFNKKFKYILFRTDVIEEGKAIFTKERQMRLRHDVKHPKEFYTDTKGNRIYVFFDRLNDSVKFDFSLFPNYTEQIKREVVNVSTASSFILSELFSKGILNINKEQQKTLLIIASIIFLGGFGIGMIFALLIFIIFFPCQCQDCLEICNAMIK